MTEAQAAELLLKLDDMSAKIDFSVAADYVFIGALIGAVIVIIMGVYLRDL